MTQKTIFAHGTVILKWRKILYASSSPTETFLHLNILLLLLTLMSLLSASYTSKTWSPMKPETF